MAFLVLDKVEFSGKYNGMFQLERRSEECRGSYSPYLWKSSTPFLFKGCDHAELLSCVVNLYLQICTDSELSGLLDKTHFLKVKAYYGDEECSTAYVEIWNLTFKDLNDPRYQKLLLSCPEIFVPCTFDLGPLWHFLGLNREMCKERHIYMGYTGARIGQGLPVSDYVMGTQLFGRDAYPGEDTEEKIRQAEEGDEIFIVR